MAKLRWPIPERAQYQRSRERAVTIRGMEEVLKASGNDTEAAHGASEDGSERTKARSVALRLAQMNAQTPFAYSARARGRLIQLISEGLTIAQAARRVGTQGSSVHHLRRRDPDFDSAVLAAIELASSPVLNKLRDIALANSDSDPSMAGVRAAEIYLKGTHQAYRLPDNRSAQVKVSRTTADGETYTLSASTNGIPD